MDGFTFYYDVYAKQGIATTKIGLDYGHDWFVELRANSQEDLAHLQAGVRQVFGEDNIIGETQARQRSPRVYAY